MQFSYVHMIKAACTVFIVLTGISLEHEDIDWSYCTRSAGTNRVERTARVEQRILRRSTVQYSM